MLKRLLRIILILPVLLCTFGVQAIHADNEITANISSDYAIVMDQETGQVLSEKNADERMYPASLTKMMTAIIAMENLTDYSETITITAPMFAGLYEQNASLAGFQVGDEPTVEDIFYGIALPSGADACNAAAITISGSVSSFVNLMNQKAQEIGMTNTHFVNTTGLHDENHYSTARDMALLLQYCLKNEEFVKVFSSRTYTTSPLASAPNGIFLQSTTWPKAMRYGISLPGMAGVKTGFTYPAGRCMAYWADINDMHLVIVTAHAPENEEGTMALFDANALLNILQSWNKQNLMKKGDTIQKVTVKYPFHSETVSIKAPETVTMDVSDSADIKVTANIPSDITMSKSSESYQADITITVDDKSVYTGKTTLKLDDANFFEKIVLGIRNLF